MIEIKIPESIKIGGHTYLINWEPMLHRTEGRQGRICFPSQDITLLTELHPDAEMESFIHEVLHGIDNVYLNDHLSEDDISNMSEGLSQVLIEMGIRFVRSLND